MQSHKTESSRIFIIFHKEFFPDYYKKDPNFDSNLFHFMKTEGYMKNKDSQEEKLSKLKEQFTIHKESDFPFYNPKLQEQKYFAPTVPYHVYKNGLHKNLSYIGFMEYDLRFESSSRIPSLEKKFTSFTDEIKYLINLQSPLVICPSIRWEVKKLLSQHEIKIRIDGVLTNPILAVILDYNDYFKTCHRLEDFYDEYIPTQQSFISDTETFDRVFSFISHLIDENRFDPKLCIPRPSTILERYIGMALLLDPSPFYSIPLIHEEISTKKGSWN